MSKNIRPKDLNHDNADGSGRRFRYTTFAERVTGVDLATIQRSQLRVDKDLIKDNDSLLCHKLTEWRELDCSTAFSNFSRELMPLCGSLPLVLFNRERIVECFEKHLAVPDSLAIRPVSTLVTYFAFDLQDEFLPLFPRIFTALVALLEITESEVVEQYVRRFAAESFAFLFRRLPADKAALVLDLLLAEMPANKAANRRQTPLATGQSAATLGSLTSMEALAALSPQASDFDESLCFLFFDVIKGVPGRLHSRGTDTLVMLLDRLDQLWTEDLARAERFKAVLIGLNVLLCGHSEREHSQVAIQVYLDRLADLGSLGETSLAAGTRYAVCMRLLSVWLSGRGGQRVDDWAAICSGVLAPSRAVLLAWSAPDASATLLDGPASPGQVFVAFAGVLAAVLRFAGDLPRAAISPLASLLFTLPLGISLAVCRSVLEADHFFQHALGPCMQATAAALFGPAPEAAMQATAFLAEVLPLLLEDPRAEGILTRTPAGLVRLPPVPGRVRAGEDHFPEHWRETCSPASWPGLDRAELPGACATVVAISTLLRRLDLGPGATGAGVLDALLGAVIGHLPRAAGAPGLPYSGVVSLGLLDPVDACLLHTAAHLMETLGHLQAGLGKEAALHDRQWFGQLFQLAPVCYTSGPLLAGLVAVLQPLAVSDDESEAGGALPAGVLATLPGLVEPPAPGAPVEAPELTPLGTVILQMGASFDTLTRVSALRLLRLLAPGLLGPAAGPDAATTVATLLARLLAVEAIPLDLSTHRERLLEQDALGRYCAGARLPAPFDRLPTLFLLSQMAVNLRLIWPNTREHLAREAATRPGPFAMVVAAALEQARASAIEAASLSGASAGFTGAFLPVLGLAEEPCLAAPAPGQVVRAPRRDHRTTINPRFEIVDTFTDGHVRALAASVRLLLAPPVALALHLNGRMVATVTGSRLDFAAFEVRLWDMLQEATSAAERIGRSLVPLMLATMDKYLEVSSLLQDASPAAAAGATAASTDKDAEEDAEEDADEEEEDLSATMEVDSSAPAASPEEADFVDAPEMAPIEGAPVDAGTGPAHLRAPHRRHMGPLLEAHLAFLARFRAVRSVFQGEALRERVLLLLCQGDARVQQAALEALLRWRPLNLDRYADAIGSLIHEKRFRGELSQLMACLCDEHFVRHKRVKTDNRVEKYGSFGTTGLEPADRRVVMEVVLRVLFGKLFARDGRAKKALAGRRVAILALLAQGCTPEEHALFVGLMVRPFLRGSADDPARALFTGPEHWPTPEQLTFPPSADAKSHWPTPEQLTFPPSADAKSVPLVATAPRALQTGFLSTAGSLLEQLAGRAQGFMPLFMALFLAIGQGKLHHPAAGHAVPDLPLEQLVLRRLAAVTTQIPGFDYSPYVATIHAGLVTPRLELFTQGRGLQHRVGLLELLRAWSSQASCAAFLGPDYSPTLLPTLVGLLSHPQASVEVLQAIIDIVANLVAVASCAAFLGPDYSPTLLPTLVGLLSHPQASVEVLQAIIDIVANLVAVVDGQAPADLSDGKATMQRELRAAQAAMLQPAGADAGTVATESGPVAAARRALLAVVPDFLHHVHLLLQRTLARDPGARQRVRAERISAFAHARAGMAAASTLADGGLSDDHLGRILSILARLSRGLGVATAGAAPGSASGITDSTELVALMSVLAVRPSARLSESAMESVLEVVSNLLPGVHLARLGDRLAEMRGAVAAPAECPSRRVENYSARARAALGAPAIDASVPVTAGRPAAEMGHPLSDLLAPLFASLRTLPTRAALCRVFVTMADAVPSMGPLAAALVDLHTADAQFLDVVDWERRASGFRALREQVMPTAPAAVLAPALHALSFFLRDVDDYSLRSNASLCWSALLQRIQAGAHVGCATHSPAEQHHLELLLLTVFMAGIRRAIRFSKEAVQQEFLQLLGQAVNLLGRHMPYFFSLFHLQFSAATVRKRRRQQEEDEAEAEAETEAEAEAPTAAEGSDGALLGGSVPLLLGSEEALAASAGGDALEGSFFENVFHLQASRRTQALRQLRQSLRENDTPAEALIGATPPEEGALLRVRVDLGFLNELMAPLAVRLALESMDASLQDEAIALLGAIAGHLPLDKFVFLFCDISGRFDRPAAKTRLLIRMLVTVVDAFHFTVGELDPAVLAAEGAIVDGEPGDGDEGGPESEDEGDDGPEGGDPGPQGPTDKAPGAELDSDNDESDDEPESAGSKGPATAGDAGAKGPKSRKASPAEAILRPAAVLSREALLRLEEPARVHYSITATLLPRLYRLVTRGAATAIAAGTGARSKAAAAAALGGSNSTVSSTSMMSIADNSTSVRADAVTRLPLALSAVKLMRALPESAMATRLPSVLATLSALMRSKDEAARDTTRKTLVAVARLLGPRYLVSIVCDLSSALRRGYQVHVLGFTVYTLMEAMMPSLSPMRVVPELVEELARIFTADVSGLLAEEKDVAGLAAKGIESRVSRAPEGFGLIGRLVVPETVLLALGPVCDVLASVEDSRTNRRVEALLRRLIAGIVQNRHFPRREALVLAHSLIVRRSPVFTHTQRMTAAAQATRAGPRRNRDQDLDPDSDIRGQGVGSTAFGISARHEQTFLVQSLNRPDAERDAGLSHGEAAVRRFAANAHLFTDAGLGLVTAVIKSQHSERMRASAADRAAAAAASGPKVSRAGDDDGPASAEPDHVSHETADLEAAESEAAEMETADPEAVARRAARMAEDVALLDPFVEPLLGFLSARRNRLLPPALTVSSRLLQLPLPSLDGRHETAYAEKLFQIVLDSPSTGDEVALAALRALTLVVRHRPKAIVDPGKLERVIAVVSPELESADPRVHGAAFPFFRALLARRVVSPGMEATVDQLSRLLVVSPEQSVRSASRQLLLRFVLDYPLPAGRLAGLLHWLVEQLAYEFELGRLSVIQLHMDFMRFLPAATVQANALLWLLPLVFAHVGDQATQCRALAGAVIGALVARLEPRPLDQVLALLRSWLAGGRPAPARSALDGAPRLSALTPAPANPELARAGAQLAGLLNDALGDRFQGSAAIMAPLLLDRLVELLTGPRSRQVDAIWQTVYSILGALMKLLRDHPQRVGPRLHWPLLLQTDVLRRGLLFPHAWVRKATARLVGQLLAMADAESLVIRDALAAHVAASAAAVAAADVSASAPAPATTGSSTPDEGAPVRSKRAQKRARAAQQAKSLEGEEAAPAAAAPAAAPLPPLPAPTLLPLVVSLARFSLRQLYSDNLDSEHGDQIVRNLFFLSRVLYQHGDLVSADAARREAEAATSTPSADGADSDDADSDDEALSGLQEEEDSAGAGDDGLGSASRRVDRQEDYSLASLTAGESGASDNDADGADNDDPLPAPSASSLALRAAMAERGPAAKRHRGHAAGSSEEEADAQEADAPAADIMSSLLVSEEDRQRFVFGSCSSASLLWLFRRMCQIARREHLTNRSTKKRTLVFKWIAAVFQILSPEDRTLLAPMALLPIVRVISLSADTLPGGPDLPQRRAEHTTLQRLAEEVRGLLRTSVGGADTFVELHDATLRYLQALRLDRRRRTRQLAILRPEVVAQRRERRNERTRQSKRSLSEARQLRRPTGHRIKLTSSMPGSGVHGESL
ncbi:hypothetical protein H696_01385 [Fonticula alba]|uniref:Uncharacterized protein n=1 Tax=Fonticula alba TaxID=691883 RepID=A0A058ZEU8_FONAL|nr:hypothetical protein H696_01385 [Fonticula alba]KCV71977.1 hypothetical protein H696_01385 [Fonticula alba]|eukprot:XP_009493555.1 hypothetical protein H696_01385 [Fonticula alba]